MSTVTDTILERRARWTAFIDQPDPPRHLFMIRVPNAAGERPPLHPQYASDHVDWAVRKYRGQLEQIEWLDDDFVPYLDMLTGTEIFAEAFGCPVERPDDQMPFARPCVFSAEEAATVVVPRLEDSTLMRFIEMAEQARDRAGDEALLRLPDVQSPMDVTALIWDKGDLFLAMHETPEAVIELSHKVIELQTAFFDTWFERFGDSFVAHYPDYYLPRGLSLSEDEIGAVSAHRRQGIGHHPGRLRLWSANA